MDTKDDAGGECQIVLKRRPGRVAGRKGCHRDAVKGIFDTESHVKRAHKVGDVPENARSRQGAFGEADLSSSPIVGGATDVY